MANRMNLNVQSKTKLSVRGKASAIAGTLLAAVLIVVMQPVEYEGRLAGYDWRVSLSLDTSKVAFVDTHFDFPLRISYQHPSLRPSHMGGELQHPEGFDIRFSAQDGATPLLHEIISYDPESGHVEAWVNLDTLSPDKENQIYLYFGAIVPVSEQNLSLGERDFQGHFYLKNKGSKQKAAFAKEWVELEKINKKDPTGFFIPGEVESVKAPLPVKFQYFKADARSDKLILVEWGTDFESNNDFFEVERSFDAKTYSNLTTMGGGDASARLLRYSYADDWSDSMKVYYRLKQVNNDGLYTYSTPILSAHSKAAAGITIQEIVPNPFAGTFSASFSSGISEQVTIQLFTVKGDLIHEEVFAAKHGVNTFSFVEDITSLEAGVYILTFMGSDKKLKVAQVIKEKGI